MSFIDESSNSHITLHCSNQGITGFQRSEQACIPVSVIIPCYKCSATIGRALTSVFSQTTLPRQIILVNDGNPPSFHQLVTQLVEHSPVREILILQNLRNLGPSATRNKAWNMATQAYIAFLDADDAWHPHKLERQHALFVSNPKLHLAAHRSICVKESFHPEPSWVNGNITPITPLHLLMSSFFSTPTVMLRHDIPFRFDVRMKYAEDYDLWTRIILSGYQGVFDSAPMTFLYKSRFGESGLSSRLFPMERGVQRVYHHLANSGLISTSSASLLRLYSSMKFMKRIIQTAINRIWRNTLDV